MLDAQMKRGLIENCVLAALARGDSYGYQIIKDMSAFVAVTESTLYPSLRRLESFAADWGELAAMFDFIREGLGHE